MDCPRCGYGVDGEPVCPRCGIVFAKLSADRRRQPRPEPPPVAPAGRSGPGGWSVAAGLAGLLLLGGFLLRSRRPGGDAPGPAPLPATAPAPARQALPLP